MPTRKNSAPQGQPSSEQDEGGLSAAIAPTPPDADAIPWTFLTNHAHVLIVLHAEPDMVLRQVAARVGITERAVQRIVHELVQGGFLLRERIGRRNHYQISSGKHLRHPVESHCTIDQLLTLIHNTN